MHELINVTLNDTQEPVVSGRQLHKVLGVNSNYTTWFERMTEYGFAEGQDFLPNLEKSTGGRRAVDHIIKLDMAKEIAMIQRTDKGKEVRQYFIQVEKDFNSPEKIMARALLIADKQNKQLKAENEALRLDLQKQDEKTRYLDLILDSKASLRVTQIAQDYGMTALKFNKLLHEYGVQHKVNQQWILYSKHMGKGYTDSATFDFIDSKGQPRTHIVTMWTQRGRLFIYELLKKKGVLPLVEREDWRWKKYD
ncbi:phage antirepressor KilAC domain-containing protein [Streptococcus sp. zg-JUN1979]|uniref:phage antirepressor KilAC domain-containing protein n=1 Tax=Streptococcus sp. zg-JUN1979 TaxID=3391450 RepID=UPI0039A5BB7B